MAKSSRELRVWHAETSLTYLNHMLDHAAGTASPNRAIWLPSVVASILEVAVILDSCRPTLSNDSCLVTRDGYLNTTERNARRAMAAVAAYTAAASLSGQNPHADLLRDLRAEFHETVNGDQFLSDLFHLHLWKVFRIADGGTYYQSTTLIELTLGTLNGAAPDLRGAIDGASAASEAEGTEEILRRSTLIAPARDFWDYRRIHVEFMLRRRYAEEALHSQPDILQWLERLLLDV